jgi:hypothetical protein
MRIRSQHFFQFRNQGFDNPKIFFIVLNKQKSNLLIPRPPQRTPKLQEKLSALKREHPELQNIKFLYFFLFLWIIFALLDPDPETQNVYPYRSRSETFSALKLYR